MGRRSVSSLLLAVAGAAVVAAVVVLVFQVKSAAPPAEVDAAELAGAAESAPAPALAPVVDRRADPGGADAPLSPKAPTLGAERPQVPTEAGRALRWSGVERAFGARGAIAQAPRGEEVIPPPEVIPPVTEAAAADMPAGSDSAGPHQAAIDEVVRLYDAGDYENARARAIQLLEVEPNNERILRIATSTSCLMGEVDQARAFYQRLTPIGQRQMARRCRRYGVEL